MSDLHFYDLHTSSYKMIYFYFNIYKWTLTLPMVESSSAVFAIYFSGQLGQIENVDFSDIADFFL